MIKQEFCTIVSHRQIANNIYELILQGELVNEMGEPGQFVHVKIGRGIDPLLRRPISISSINKEKGQFTLIYRVEGRGTTLLSEMAAGERLDVLGPLGNGFPVGAAAEGETALLVGGGIGVPPLYELSRQLISSEVEVIHVLGFQTENAVFYEEAFGRLGKTYVATDDGTYGEKGFVTDVIRKMDHSFDIVYACGPKPMLKVLEQEYGGSKKMYLSLEERMGCGIGACFACVCRTKESQEGQIGYKKVCSDGPVFRAGEVIL